MAVPFHGFHQERDQWFQALATGWSGVGMWLRQQRNTTAPIGGSCEVGSAFRVQRLGPPAEGKV
jgi:hypothetical protein